MSYSLNSLKGLYRGLYREPLQGAFKGDTRSLDYGSNELRIQSILGLPRDRQGRTWWCFLPFGIVPNTLPKNGPMSINYRGNTASSSHKESGTSYVYPCKDPCKLPFETLYSSYC